MKKTLLFTALFSLLFFNSFSQTPVAGDIAFIGWNTDSPDGFAWITLADIPGSTDIVFTDEGLSSSTTWVGTTEDHWRYTTPSAGLPIGTIVTMNESSGSFIAYVSAGVSTAGSSLTWIAGGSSGNHNLSAGDQMIAYLGSSKPSTPTSVTFIAGVHGDDGNGSPTCFDSVTKWNGPTSCVTSVSKSVVPNGLTNAVNCVALFPAIGTEQDNAKYTGTLTGTSTFLRAEINNYTNWTTSNSVNQSIQPSDYPSPAVLGTDDLLLESFKVFPNPTTAIVNITIPIEKVNIYDITGKKVLEAYDSVFSVKKLNPGVYFMAIITDKGTAFRKLAKK